MPSNAPRKTIAPAAIAAERFDLFGAPALLAGEDRSAYDALLARVAGEIDPQDTLEMMWVRDIVDLLWETLRYRRYRCLIIDAARRDAVLHLGWILPESWRAKRNDGSARSAAHLGDYWVLGGQDARAEIVALMNDQGLGEETIAAEAYRLRGEDIERVEKLLVSAELRRNAVLREIGAYRDGFAARARASADGIIDAETVDVEEPSPKLLAG